MSDIGETVQAIGAQVMKFTGYQPFLYSEHPTPSTARYVFHGGSYSASKALTHVNELLALATLGKPLPYPYYYACPHCMEHNDSPQARDEHVATHSVPAKG